MSFPATRCSCTARGRSWPEILGKGVGTFARACKPQAAGSDNQTALRSESQARPELALPKSAKARTYRGADHKRELRSSEKPLLKRTLGLNATK